MHDLLLKGRVTDIRPSRLLGAASQGLLHTKGTDIRRHEHKTVYATGEGYLFRNLRPMREAADPRDSRSSRFFGMRYSQFRNAYRYSTTSLFRNDRVAEAYWITDNHTVNYYHWIAEALTRLYLVRQADKDALVLLPHWLEKDDYVHGSAKALGMKNIRFIPEGRSVRVDRLFTIDPPEQVPELAQPLRDLLRNYFKFEGGPERVYISRNDATKRRTANEEDVQAVVRARGFEVAEMSKLNFRDQARLMMDCRYLVSTHGAGLTNMIFMQPGGKILEFRTKHETFLVQSSALELNHYSLSVEKLENRSDHHSAIRVNPAALEQALDVLMKN